VCVGRTGEQIGARAGYAPAQLVSEAHGAGRLDEIEIDGYRSTPCLNKPRAEFPYVGLQAH
jgi:hypothetical protein